jgi:hypothetical protein
VTRVQRREGILEDDLHPAAERLEVALAEIGDVLAVEADPARRRPVQPEQRPADRRLPASRLADEAERLAAANVERDVVDGANVAHVPVEHDPRPDREVHLQVLDLDQVAVGAHSSTVHSRHAPGTGPRTRPKRA